MRVLVIEDDAELAEAIGTGLRRERMAVDIALDGSAGLDRALVTGFDVIVPTRLLIEAWKVSVPTSWLV